MVVEVVGWQLEVDSTEMQGGREREREKERKMRSQICDYVDIDCAGTYILTDRWTDQGTRLPCDQYVGSTRYSEDSY